MLDNKLKLNTDGTNVYATLYVKARRPGLIILTVINLLLISLVIFFASTVQLDQNPSVIFPLIIFGLLIIVFPLRYLLWNSYGKEQLIITKKSLSFSYDYGLFQTNLKTFEHNRLGLAFEEVRKSDCQSIGRLMFIRYDEKTDLPETIYQTTILLSMEHLEEIEVAIGDLYQQQLNEEFSFYPTSLN